MTTPHDYEVSIIVPTFNEAQSLPELLRRIDAAMATTDVAAEVILVDDNSPDGTAEVARRTPHNSALSVIERRADRGLGPSVVDGLRVARGTYVVVMDADLQHPPEAIAELLACARAGADFVIGSRYVGGADLRFGAFRRLSSAVATFLAAPLIGRRVRDPMAGFFCFRRDRIDPDVLNPIGYKIGLEILVKCRPRRVVEVPIAFGPRLAGRSKLNMAERFAYLRHLVRLYRWRCRSSRSAEQSR